MSHSLRLIVPVLATMGAVALTRPADATPVKYVLDATTALEADGWSFIDYNATASYATAGLTLTSTKGYAEWMLRTSSTGTAPTTGWLATVQPGRGFWVEAKLKVSSAVQCSLGGPGFRVDDGKTVLIVAIDTAKVHFMTDTTRDLSATTTDDFHVYRLTNLGAGHYTLAIDGNVAAGDLDGSVAARNVPKNKQKAYAAKLAELRQYDAGSPDHKRIRREMYEMTSGTKLDYGPWSVKYDTATRLARRANEIVAREARRLGVVTTEESIKLPKGEQRRLDIVDLTAMHGIEVKAYELSKIYATKEILDEVRRDAILVKQGWSIDWLLIDTEASGPLLKALSDAGILVEMRSTRGDTTVLTRLIAPSW